MAILILSVPMGEKVNGLLKRTASSCFMPGSSTRLMSKS